MGGGYVSPPASDSLLCSRILPVCAPSLSLVCRSVCLQLRLPHPLKLTLIFSYPQPHSLTHFLFSLTGIQYSEQPTFG